MFLTNFFGKAAQNDAIKVLTPSEFKEALQQKSVQLIDVRTPNEFANGTIKGAKNMNLFDGSGFKTAAAKLDKTLPVYLFCQSSNRSKSASSLLVKMGFSQVFDLRGGFSNWS